MNAVTNRAAAFLLLMSLSACGGRDLSGPPELRAGRDECAECGMIVADERACAALLVEIEGRREYRLFDDLGCLVDFIDAHSVAGQVLEGWAVDHTDGEWLPLKGAHYLLADSRRLMTPMGSGFVAYADPAAALRGTAEFGGSVASFDDLADARRAWRASLHSGIANQEPDHDD
ncbi:MAG: nitrous oxide reductase accessory protein NosL [Phycisphaeraceae bacterium]|nr:nitrous oxide reductase accessory protein NosL [Phycisphaeraceae bacterium]MCW5769669.1 nitrous oxide reductase accessory protein NosL [Phycisphaeraceae bacterium]